MRMCVNALVITTLVSGASVAAAPAATRARPALPALARDVVVVTAGSSITINRYGCPPVPASFGGADRLPPQMNGQNVFFRVWDMLNDHRNMCWRRLTDKDWTRTGDWKPETRLAYNGACYGLRVAYAANAPGTAAELAVPAGFEKLDLLYTSDPKGDRIKVTIDGAAPPENALVDTFQETRIPPDADLGTDIETLDSHGEPRKLARPKSGIANLADLRARFRLDPARAHVVRVERASDDPAKRILVWGAVYWRGNCVQVVQRAKGGINCGDLPNYPAIQEVLALKPDYLLLEAINIRGNPEGVRATLDPPFAWCGQQVKKGRFKVLVYATSMGNCRAHRAWFAAHGNASEAKMVRDENADACVQVVADLCKTYGLPLVDVGPVVDEYLAKNPSAKFVPHIQNDWYHPNQWGAALFARTIYAGIREHWPELPVRPVQMPDPPGRS